ncbi:MAG: VPLPA-CTERM sorting domain-containing protein [Pseudomonadota bacterium]
MSFKAVVLAAMVMLGSVSLASAVTIGNAPIDRGNQDGRQNLVIITGTIIPEAGTITEWSTYIRRREGGASADTEIGLLILRDDGLDYELLAIDEQNAVLGLNTFTPGTPLTVEAGDRLGVWITDHKVSYAPDGGPDLAQTAADSFVLPPVVGSQIVINNAFNPGRTYSLSAALHVPLPASLPLVLAGLGAFALLRGRQKAA